MKRISMDALEFDRKITELSAAENAESNSEKVEKVKSVMAKIIKNELTPRQRETIVLYYYKGMGVCEIAQTLGLAPCTVSRTLKYARQKIYKYLKYFFM